VQIQATRWRYRQSLALMLTGLIGLLIMQLSPFFSSGVYGVYSFLDGLVFIYHGYKECMHDRVI